MRIRLSENGKRIKETRIRKNRERISETITKIENYVNADKICRKNRERIMETITKIENVEMWTRRSSGID